MFLKYKNITIDECARAITDTTKALELAVNRNLPLSILFSYESVNITLVHHDGAIKVILNNRAFIAKLDTHAEVERWSMFIRDVIYAQTDFELGVAWGKYIAR